MSEVGRLDFVEGYKEGFAAGHKWATEHTTLNVLGLIVLPDLPTILQITGLGDQASYDRGWPAGASIL